MRRAPPLTQLPLFPISGGTAVLAIVATLARMEKWDISALTCDYHILQFQLWRLLTSTLPHVNPFHLMFNLYWLWTFGTMIESAFGHVRTLLLFGILAAGSSAAEFAILHGGVGLSGVGYGLFGFLWVLSRRSVRFQDAIDPGTVSLFVGWFFLCIVLTYTDVMPVANIAHGVGALLGALIGWGTVEQSSRRVMVWIITLILLLSTIFGATVGRAHVNFSNDGQNEAYLGYQALMDNKSAEALHWCAQAVRIEPGNASAWNNLGIAYQKLGQTREAVEAFRTADRLNGKKTPV